MKKSRFFICLGLLFCFSSCSCEGFDSDVLYKYAGREHDKGNFKRAIMIYEKVLKTDSDNAIVVYDLGVAYIDVRNWAAAKKQLYRLRELGRKDLAQQLSRLLSLRKQVK